MQLPNWIAIGLLLPGMAIAQETYTIDPVHSRVAFRVMHAGFSPSLGTVSQPAGRIVQTIRRQVSNQALSGLFLNRCLKSMDSCGLPVALYR